MMNTRIIFFEVNALVHLRYDIIIIFRMTDQRGTYNPNNAAGSSYYSSGNAGNPNSGYYGTGAGNVRDTRGVAYNANVNAQYPEGSRVDRQTYQPANSAPPHVTRNSGYVPPSSS